MGRKRKPPVEPSGRKRSGQPGHDGKTRDLVPEGEVDSVVDRDPEQCERRAEPLAELRMNQQIRAPPLAFRLSPRVHKSMR